MLDFGGATYGGYVLCQGLHCSFFFSLSWMYLCLTFQALIKKKVMICVGIIWSEFFGVSPDDVG